MDGRSRRSSPAGESTPRSEHDSRDGRSRGIGTSAALGRPFPPFLSPTLLIAPVSLEIAPGKIVKTVGYNGSVPGPILRFQEGKPVTVDVVNDTDVPETVHWHGQHLPSGVDGSMEEGTPPVPPHGHRRYR